MESAGDTSTGHDEPNKKCPYDDLNRDELIKKCKGLLLIAQKAKLAKQEIQAEMEQVKAQLTQTAKEKCQDDGNIRTLQELVESLTEQKLTYITELDAANKRQTTLSAALDESRGLAAACQDKMAELAARASDLDSEVVSLRRQNQRLEKENEELIGQLGQLEAAAGEQRQQLQILEESVDKGMLTAEYQKKIDELKEYISCLENDLQSRDEKIFKNENEQKAIIEKLSEETTKYEIEKEKKEKANTRLKNYREKLVKCSSSITQLKNTKFILLKTVKDYSESIPKWQNEMARLSKMLSDQFNDITSENKLIKQKILDYESRLVAMKHGFEQLQNENMMLNNKNKELQQSLQLIRIKTSEEKDSEHLILQIKGLVSEKMTLVKEKQAAKDSLVELESQNSKLASDFKSLETNIQTMEVRINFLECENTTLKNQLKEKITNQCQELKNKLKTLQDQLDSLKTENTTITDLNNILKEEVETLKSSLERPSDDGENLSELNVSLQTDITKLETKLSAYKQENSSLLADMKEMRGKVKELTAANAEFEEIKAKMINYKTENAELLNEMKEVNQVLKERGESISKKEKAMAEMERLIETLEKDRELSCESKSAMEKRIKELEDEMKNLLLEKSKNEEECNNFKTELEKLQKELENKESALTCMKEEIEKLKQQQSSNLEQPNEDMSTSTMSRAEDYARMKELDETFEEKYTKLKIFALKLKKKANDLTQQLEASEAEKARLEKLLNESGATAKNVRAIQQQYEEALNRIEEQKLIIQKFGPDTEEIKVDCKEKLETAVENVEKANKIETTEKIVASDAIVKELEERIETLTKEIDESKKTMSKEIEKLEADLAKKESDLLAEMEQHKGTRETLDRARRDVKKKSVLSLEMEDYERSMKDLTTKMEESKKKMTQMESTIDTQKDTITSLKTQIKLLEDQIKAEENENRITKDELHDANDMLKDKDSVIQAKNDVIQKLEQEVEAGKRSYEDLKLELTGVIGEREKVVASLGQDKAELGSRLKRAETRCGELQDSLRVTTIELDDLKTEFASYKVRAQAVLRQSQTVDHAAEERLQEELATAREQQHRLAAQLDSVRAELEETRSTLSGERRRAAEAGGEAARAQQRTARLAADLQRLTHQLEAERSSAKIQTATLTQCYKSQLAELEARLERETQELRQEVESARASAAAAPRDHRQFLLPLVKDDSDAELDLNVAMLPREEGEGSEAAPSPPLSKPYSAAAPGRTRSPVPLDRLLEEGVPEDDVADSAGLGLTEEQEIHDLRRKLSAQMQRVEHATQLLAECERECVRRAQLAELLKAELRRARGSQQAHNTQYMKNVTLKFLTLPVGDERCRLVPVLQKILTLSNEETQTLQAVAKGQDPNSKGWGSYLPWPGK